VKHSSSLTSSPRTGGFRPGLIRLALLVLTAALLPAGIATAQAPPIGPVPAPAPTPPVSVLLTYEAEVTDNYTGPVYVVFASGGSPQQVPRAFGRDPIVVVDVEDWKPGVPLLVNAANARCAPMDFEDIPPANYFIRAFMKLDPDSYKPGSDGNGASRTLPVRAAAFDTMPIQLTIVRRLAPVRFGRESDRVISDTVRSELLSDFHGDEIRIGYTVVLPPGYFIETERRYPSRIWLGAHATNHRVGASALRPLETYPGGNDIVTVLIDVTSRFGHPYFVDSASSGPWERALLEEVLPQIEREYRLDPAGRFLTGHASGAWSAIWLQLHNPDQFAGVWAIAPWPTTWTSWFGVNLYEDENALTDADGQPRAYGVMADGRGVETAAVSWRRDDLLVDGGPFRSYEWAFSPPGEDGRPRHFFDRRTGVIDRSVIEHWKQWDLVDLVERGGEELAAALRTTPITVRVGGRDGYQVEEPIRRLVAAMEAAGIAVNFEFEPDLGHGNIAEIEYQMGALKAMVDRYRASIRAAEFAAPEPTPAGPASPDAGGSD
jgi:S-formylglutathione hydrolase FrmB